jgi:hypothetical protein
MTDAEVRCRHCRRKLRRPEYAARRAGERCGGRIRKRRNAMAPRRPVAGLDEQLELDLEAVSG